jgi:putative ABC transport system permease protein
VAELLPRHRSGYGVTQRTREISLRTALGATRWNIVRLIAGQGAAMTVSGLAIGFTVAAFAARLLSQFLYRVTTHDIRSYLAVAAVLIAISTLACAMPARRAASIDPLKGLKQ